MKQIPEIPPEWLKQSVIAVLEKFPNIKKKVIDQIENNMIPLNFAVFGYAGTGKTTLLNRMQYGMPTEPEPTIRIQKLNDFEVKLVGMGKKRFSGIHDVPGRPEEAGATSANENEWPDWKNVFSEQTPCGIIFIIDHLNKEKNKAALRYVIEMIEHSYESEPKGLITKIVRFFRSIRLKSKENLKVFLLIVNKLDIWEENIVMKDILENYNEEIEEIKSIMKRNEGRFYVEKMSAKMGTNFEITFQNFIMGLLTVSA